MKKYGAKLDAEHSRVKVTYETPAEVLGLVDKQSIDYNSAAEDFTDDEHEVKKRLELGKQRINKLNIFEYVRKLENISQPSAANKSTEEHVRHHKRHVHKRKEQIEKLRRVLDGKLLICFELFIKIKYIIL